MAGFYDRLAATALDLLSRFGQDVSRVRVTPGAYDPATGAAGESEASATFKGALLDFNNGTTTFQGTLVQVGDRRLLIEAGAAPNTDDKIVVGGVTWSVLSVREINPAGIPVVYSLHLRK